MKDADASELGGIPIGLGKGAITSARVLNAECKKMQVTCRDKCTFPMLYAQGPDGPRLVVT